MAHQFDGANSIGAMKATLLLILALTAAALSGCGGGGADEGSDSSSADRLQQLEQETRANASDFPAARGRTLQQMADAFEPGPQVALGASVYRTGRNRLAFGMLDAQNSFVYAPAAVYVGKSADDRARGPYPAVADSLITDPPFRSRGEASEDDPFASIYTTFVPFSRPGKWEALVATRLNNRMLAGTAVFRVLTPGADPVPFVGEKAPAVKTDTASSAAGNVEAIDTRVPPDDMHEVSFDQVAGKKPAALLFAAPALCESRVCGPVVDIAAQLKQKYGDRVEFIHQEAYVDNNLNKGFRAPLRAFSLETEPWLFTVDRTGRVAARLEGSFGLGAFERAVTAALR